MGIKLKRVKYNSYPINDNSLSRYIENEYPGFEITGENTVIIKNYKRFCQRDFKDKQNCSITSMSSLIHYYADSKSDIKDIYSTVRKIAFFFLYTPHLFGTLSFTIGPILSLSLKKLGVPHKTGYGLFKGIGFSRQKIKNKINAGCPIILSLFRDGRNYYKNHTVTVLGYKTVYNKNEELLFLALNDNWSDEIRYLDFKKLWFISAINY